MIEVMSQKAEKVDAPLGSIVGRQSGFESMITKFVKISKDSRFKEES
jgi:hypothetical protein